MQVANAIGSRLGTETDRGATAARLLTAVSALMIERGETEISLADIAKRSGLNSALVKYHFGNKDGLLLALLQRDASSAVKALDALLRLDASPTARLRLHIAGIVNAYYRSPYLNRLINLMLHHRGPEIARAVADFFVKPLVAFETRLLEEGAARGEFRRIDPLIFYFTLFGACDHLFYGRQALLHAFGVTEVGDELRRKLIAHVTDMVLGATLAREG